MNRKINLGKHEFELYRSPREIKIEKGVYVILCKKDDKCEVIDVGESGWSIWSKQTVGKRLSSHNRKNCWEKYCDGELLYAVLAEEDGDKRLKIEEELRKEFRPPCGTGPPGFPDR